MSAPGGAAVSVSVLGPVELWVDGQPVPLGGAKPRAILAQLALAGGRVVSAEELIDGLWGEDPSDNAKNTLQYHVGVLRRVLSGVGLAHTLQTKSPGYASSLPVDLRAFADLRSAAERAYRAGALGQAAELYESALACWSGPALANLRDQPFAEARAVSLDGQRLTCLELWCEAELELGHAEAVVQRSEELVALHPTRERFWEQLMLALYRTGRPAEALTVFRRARETMDELLGVDPSRRLQELQAAVLRQDPALLGASGLERGSAPGSEPTRLAAPGRTRVARLTGPLGLRVELLAAPILIGRTSECDVMVPDEEASRRHAQIARTLGGHELTDLGSTNGTQVNGQTITGPTTLRNGDRIAVGNFVLRYEAAAS